MSKMKPKKKAKYWNDFYPLESLNTNKTYNILIGRKEQQHDTVQSSSSRAKETPHKD